MALRRQRSEEVLAIAHKVGLEWLPIDRDVLGRSPDAFFHRDGEGRLIARGAEQL